MPPPDQFASILKGFHQGPLHERGKRTGRTKIHTPAQQLFLTDG